MFALEYAYICGGHVAGNPFNVKQSHNLHNKARVSRGARSHKRANVEKRVVSIGHSLQSRMMAKQRWKLVGSILDIPG